MVPLFAEVIYLNSRERVLAALEHKEPDRVPIDFGGAMCTNIGMKAHEKLKEFLGLKGGEIKIANVCEQTVVPDERILKSFNVDVRGIFPCHPPPAVEEKEDGYFFVDCWGVKQRMPKVGGYYFDAVSRPLERAEIEDLEKYEWPDPREVAMWLEALEVEKKAKCLYEETDYALATGFTSGVFETSWNLRGMDKFLVDLMVNERFAGKLMDKALEFAIGFWDEMLDRVGDYVQIAQIGDDMGTQTGPIMSPELFRKTIKPRNEKIIKSIKRKADVYLLFHCCGSIYHFIPDLIEVGVDALNPVQVSAKGMDTQRLKEEFGNKLTFWGGGCDTQSVLPFGTPEDVANEVRRRIKDLAPGGGFVFTQVHNVQAGTPPENIVAMLRTANEYGKYPISK